MAGSCCFIPLPLVGTNIKKARFHRKISRFSAMKPYFFQSKLSRVMLQDTGPRLGVATERQAATGHQICIPRLHDGNQMQLAICQGGEAKAWPYSHR